MEIPSEPKFAQPSSSVEPKFSLTSYQDTLPNLQKLVETQVKELAYSIGALRQFSEALPKVIDSMVAGRTPTIQRSELSPRRSSQWRRTLASQSPRGTHSESPYGEALPI